MRIYLKLEKSGKDTKKEDHLLKPEAGLKDKEDEPKKIIAIYILLKINEKI